MLALRPALLSLSGIAFVALIGGCASPRAVVDATSTVTLRGRVVCLAEEMHRRHGAGLPTRHEHLWVLRAEDGRWLTLLRGRFSEAIWLDDRVRAREVEVKGRLFLPAQALEVERLRTVKIGVVQDLYYYCAICHIQSVAPLPCDCCQGPVELVEKPLNESRQD